MVEGAHMNESHFARNLLLIIAGVLVVGYVVVSIAHILAWLFFYALVAALVIGGGIYLYHRAKRAITGGRRRGIGR